MRILGIDPGSVVSGYGILDREGPRLHYVTHGTIRPPKGEALPVRIHHIHRELCGVIETHHPEAVAVEKIFHARNAASALKLGHARGVAILAAVQAGLPIHEYSPLEVKQAVVGYGRATKEQVQRMTRILLALPDVVPEDAADALAVAICHAHAGKIYDLRRRGIGAPR